MVDDRRGVITAVATTPGDVTEASQVEPLRQQHEAHTGTEVTTVIGERGYGTVETYCSRSARSWRSVKRGWCGSAIAGFACAVRDMVTPNGSSILTGM